MMPIRNPSLVELWAQAANPLDEYLAALKDIQAWLNPSWIIHVIDQVGE